MSTDGSHLWSERYDREMTDVFEIQDEIGRGDLGSAQSTTRTERAGCEYRSLPELLKGTVLPRALTAESLAKAKEFFEQASPSTRITPPAYSGLAGYYYVLAALGMKSVGDVAATGRNRPGKGRWPSILPIVKRVACWAASRQLTIMTGRRPDFAFSPGHGG